MLSTDIQLRYPCKDEEKLEMAADEDEQGSESDEVDDSTLEDTTANTDVDNKHSDQPQENLINSAKSSSVEDNVKKIFSSASTLTSETTVADAASASPNITVTKHQEAEDDETLSEKARPLTTERNANCGTQAIPSYLSSNTTSPSLFANITQSNPDSVSKIANTVPQQPSIAQVKSDAQSLLVSQSKATIATTTSSVNIPKTTSNDTLNDSMPSSAKLPSTHAKPSSPARKLDLATPTSELGTSSQSPLLSFDKIDEAEMAAFITDTVPSYTAINPKRGSYAQQTGISYFSPLSPATTTNPTSANVKNFIISPKTSLPLSRSSSIDSPSLASSVSSPIISRSLEKQRSNSSISSEEQVEAGTAARLIAAYNQKAKESTSSSPVSPSFNPRPPSAEKPKLSHPVRHELGKSRSPSSSPVPPSPSPSRSTTANIESPGLTSTSVATPVIKQQIGDLPNQNRKEPLSISTTATPTLTKRSVSPSPSPSPIPNKNTSSPATPSTASRKEKMSRAHRIAETTSGHFSWMTTTATANSADTLTSSSTDEALTTLSTPGSACSKSPTKKLTTLSVDNLHRDSNHSYTTATTTGLKVPGSPRKSGTTGGYLYNSVMSKSSLPCLTEVSSHPPSPAPSSPLLAPKKLSLTTSASGNAPVAPKPPVKPAELSHIKREGNLLQSPQSPRRTQVT
jgi:hypothetical protein